MENLALGIFFGVAFITTLTSLVTAFFYHTHNDLY
jgi:hypothetical protein